MITEDPQPGSLYLLATAVPGLRVDIRVKDINETTVFCTIANAERIVPIDKAVFMRVVYPWDLPRIPARRLGGIASLLPYIPPKKD